MVIGIHIVHSKLELIICYKIIVVLQINFFFPVGLTNNKLPKPKHRFRKYSSYKL